MKIRNDFISPDELTNITKKFHQTKFNLKATAQAFSEMQAFHHIFRRTQQQVIKTIKTAIKDHILQIEYQLRRAQKIDSLRFFDHIGMNKNMFDEFINVSAILKEGIIEQYLEHVQDFFFHFTYKRMNPSWYRLPKRVDMPVELLDSNKKMAIYQDFISYFEAKGLFEIDLEYEEQRADEMRQEFVIGEFPTIYNQSDICKIYRLYQMSNGDNQLVLVKLKQQGFIKQKIKRQNLQGLLIDCMITGLCRIYKSTNNQNLYFGYTWNKFRKTNWPIISKNCSLDIKITLVRIGIYDNASKYEKKLVCDSIGVKIRAIRNRSKKEKKETRYYRLKQGTKKAFMDLIKKEMREIIDNKI